MDLVRLIDDYALWHETNRHSAKTIAWDRWNLGAFASWLTANQHSTEIERITIAEVRAFLQDEAHRSMLRPDHPTGIERPDQLSNRTLHCYVRAIRAFFHWLVEEEYLTKNPVARLKPPKLEQRHKEILSVDEIEQLLKQCNQKNFLGARMFAIVALLYDSGLRAGELVGLDIDDVRWPEYQIRVMGKGRKERLVPFSISTQRALRKSEGSPLPATICGGWKWISDMHRSHGEEGHALLWCIGDHVTLAQVLNDLRSSPQIEELRKRIR